MLTAGLVIADYVTFCSAIVISLGIGIYFAFSGGKQKTTSEYLMGNRNMKVLPVALSLMVSYESSITMLGFPAEVYVYGIMFWWALFGFLFANLIGILIWVPLIHPLKVTSVYEYLELRYKSRGIRLLGTTVGVLGTIFYLGIVLYGPAIALDAVTEFPIAASITTVAAVSVLYTSIGGIKAVIWTDVFQCFVMLIGMLAVITKGTLTAGGTANMFKIAENNGRLNFFNFDPNPFIRHTFWSLLFGACIRTTGLNFGQATVQRICAMPTQKEANRVLLLAGPAFLFTMSLATFEGLIAYAYYYSLGCDPLNAKIITNSNQVIPYMVLDIFKNLPGMSGLFLASLFSASLSTLSSGLAGLSAITTEDFIKPSFKGLSEFQTTLIAKLSVIFYGLAAAGISFMILNIKGPITQITYSLLAAFGAPMTGMMFYSAYCHWATKKGVVAGTISSMVLIFWISMGQSFSKTLKKTPWLPLGPTDQCLATDINATFYLNDTYAHLTTTLGIDNSYTNVEMAATQPIYSTSTENPVFDPFNENQGLDRLYSISYQWLGTIGILTFLIVGTIVSYVTGRPNPADVDVRYMLPIVDHVFPFLPMKFRQWCYGGVPFEKRQELLDKMDKGVMDYEVEYLNDNRTTKDSIDEIKLNSV